MTSTTGHRSGGTDDLEAGRAEVTPAIPAIPAPRHAPDPVAPHWAPFVPAPREPESSAARPVPQRVRAAGVRPGWIGIGVVGAVLAVTMLVAFVAAHQTMTVQGSVTVHDPWGTLRTGSSCTGAGAHAGLHSGTSVRISDATGTIVGTATLSGGAPLTSGGSNYGNYADNCVFPFTLTDVPTAGDSYRVSVGDVATDGVTFTADDLRTNGAKIFVG
jgi:hypothetical protein